MENFWYRLKPDDFLELKNFIRQADEFLDWENSRVVVKDTSS